MAPPTPSRICDTHVHLFDPGRFPYATPRRFTPGYAGIDHLRKHLHRIGAGRVVLVQPSVYGTDHRCLMAGLQALQGAGRGVAVLGRETGRDEIERLDGAGVVAARLNLVVDDVSDVEFTRQAILNTVRRIPPHWHVQLHVSLALVEALADVLRSCASHFVLDHMGLPSGPETLRTSAWRSLCDLVRVGKVTVKLSAPYLGLGPHPSKPAVGSLMGSLAEANPTALVWGTNWPHTLGTSRSAHGGTDQVEPFRSVDDLAWLDQCVEWLDALQLPPSTLDDNAQRLYRY